MNSKDFIRVARTFLRETWDELVRPNRTNGKMPRRKATQLPSTTRSRIPQPTPSASTKARRIRTGFTRILLTEAEELHAGFERATEKVLRRIKELENRFILRRLDGLLEHLDLEIVEGNLVRDPKTDWTFAICRLEPGLELRESVETINDLYAARCPVQRIDVGLRGVAGAKEYTTWLETEVALHGKPRPGLMEGLHFVIKTIQRHQLAWQSYLVYPVYKMPSELERYLSEKRLSFDDLYRYLLSLFHPVSDFDLTEWMRFKTKVGLGGEPLASLFPKSLSRELSQVDRAGRTQLSLGLETSQGVKWQLLQIRSLGVIPRTDHQATFEDTPVTSWDEPELLPLLRTRTLEELRRKLLPLIEEEGQEIRLVTTLMPVRQAHRSSVLNMHRNTAGNIKKLAGTTHELDSGIRDAAMHHRLVSLKAIESIGAGYKPLHGSIVLAVRGNNPEQTAAIHGRVQNLLQELSISFEEPRHRVGHFELYRAMLPTIRSRETSKNVFLYPSDGAKQVLRSPQRPEVREGVFMGRVLETFTEEDPEVYYVDEPFVMKLGGNQVYIGTSGSGKSMAAKLLVDRLLGTNASWYGAVMNNTEAAKEVIQHSRGWNAPVDGYDGVNLHAADFESDEALDSHLKSLTKKGVRVVHLMTQDTRPELDIVFLRWVLWNMQHRKPGILAIDETAGWFKSRDDERGGFYTDQLLRLATQYSWMTTTTIQALGTIRAAPEHAATYETIMGLAQAGTLVFYTPNIGSLAKDLNIHPEQHPRLIEYVESRVASFKLDPTGPVDKPGYAVLHSPGKAQLVKIEADVATLREFARKDPDAHESVWGL